MKKEYTLPKARLSSLNGQEFKSKGFKGGVSFDEAIKEMGITPLKRMPIKKAKRKAESCGC